MQNFIYILFSIIWAIVIGAMFVEGAIKQQEINEAKAIEYYQTINQE